MSFPRPAIGDYLRVVAPVKIGEDISFGNQIVDTSNLSQMIILPPELDWASSPSDLDRWNRLSSLLCDNTVTIVDVYELKKPQGKSCQGISMQ